MHDFEFYSNLRESPLFKKLFYLFLLTFQASELLLSALNSYDIYFHFRLRNSTNYGLREVIKKNRLVFACVLHDKYRILLTILEEVEYESKAQRVFFRDIIFFSAVFAQGYKLSDLYSLATSLES